MDTLQIFTDILNQRHSPLLEAKKSITDNFLWAISPHFWSTDNKFLKCINTKPSDPDPSSLPPHIHPVHLTLKVFFNCTTIEPIAFSAEPKFFKI